MEVKKELLYDPKFLKNMILEDGIEKLYMDEKTYDLNSFIEESFLKLLSENKIQALDFFVEFLNLYKPRNLFDEHINFEILNHILNKSESDDYFKISKLFTVSDLFNILYNRHNIELHNDIFNKLILALMTNYINGLMLFFTKKDLEMLHSIGYKLDINVLLKLIELNDNLLYSVKIPDYFSTKILKYDLFIDDTIDFEPFETFIPKEKYITHIKNYGNFILNHEQNKKLLKHINNINLESFLLGVFAYMSTHHINTHEINEVYGKDQSIIDIFYVYDDLVKNNKQTIIDTFKENFVLLAKLFNL